MLIVDGTLRLDTNSDCVLAGLNFTNHLFAHCATELISRFNILDLLGRSLSDR